MLGTDFELFIKTISGEHIPVPASLNIGDKYGKHIQLEAGTMHRDNIMVELCPYPSTTVDGITANITDIVEQAEHYLRKIMNETISLSFEPTLVFNKDALAEEYAQELGCDTDFLARSGMTVPRTPITTRLLGDTRCSGGHIHLSYGRIFKIPEPIAVHFADIVLGTLEVTMGTQGKRRELYGLPGLFRPTEYGKVRGIEYRTLSNIWLSTKERIQSMATNALSMQAVIRQEPAKKIIAFLRENWDILMAQNTIYNESLDESRALLVATQHTFSDYDWKVGE